MTNSLFLPTIQAREAWLADLYPLPNLPATLFRKLRLIPDALMTIKALTAADFDRMQGANTRPAFPWMREMFFQPQPLNPRGRALPVFPNLAAIDAASAHLRLLSDLAPDVNMDAHWVWVGATTRCGYYAKAGRAVGWNSPQPIFAAPTVNGTRGSTTTGARRVFGGLFRPTCICGEFCLNPRHWALKSEFSPEHPDLRPEWRARQTRTLVL